jgi:hypothetical protein
MEWRKKGGAHVEMAEKEAKSLTPLNMMGNVSNHHEQQKVFSEILVIFCIRSVVYLIKI